MSIERNATFRKVMDEPRVVVYSRGQLCVIYAALQEAEQVFAEQPDDEYPLLTIRSSLVVTGDALGGLSNV